MSKVKKIIKNKKGGDSIISTISVDNVIKPIESVVNNIIEDKIEIVKKRKDNKKEIHEIIVEKEDVEKLHTGYMNTVLSTSVLLHPRQMDNKIYIHLKDNLKKQHENKCYKTYGYIKNIYKIEEIQDELIDMENSECSQKYILTFSCKIYRPIINRELIAKMDKITEKISTAVNGPMKIIITPNRLNDKRFYTGTSDMVIRIKPNADILTQNHYVKIYVEGMTFADKDDLIIIIGFLIDIANPDEIKNFYDDNKIDDTAIDDF
jgi:DNA-directed RNA polymerase subunit E'/Rpb7